MAEKLRREFIELLERDVEFRYIVAGYLGLSEILKRLDGIEDNIRRLWEEVKGLREGQERLWKGQEKLWEGQGRLWEEVKELRKGQERLWEEVKGLHEGQEDLRRGQEEIRREQEGIRREQERLRRYVCSGFRDLRRALGVTFEEHAASFLEFLLDELGYPGAVVEKRYFVDDGRVVEVDLFCEEPLVVGEVTLSVESVEDAEREVGKLMERVGLVERLYGRRPSMVVLSVAKVAAEALDELRKLAEKNGVRLILGREIEEQLSL